jgi:hypothetical protein
MPHVSERKGRDDDLRKPDTTDGPERKPSGELDGHPINADETAPRETVPEPGGGGPVREPGAVDDEPGSDL